MARAYGDIELAVGAHVAANVFAFLMVNLDETLLDAPWVFEMLDPTVGYAGPTGTVAVLVAFYLLVRVFSRKGSAGFLRGPLNSTVTESLQA